MSVEYKRTKGVVVLYGLVCETTALWDLVNAKPGKVTFNRGRCYGDTYILRPCLGRLRLGCSGK